MNKLPLTRTQNIIVKNVGKELLVYDLSTNIIYRLNETSAIIYCACNGKTTFEDLISKNKFTEELIYFSLQELQKENLVQGADLTYFGALSRREVIRKVGLATLLALPVISSMLAPSSTQAQSNSCYGQSCKFNSWTQSDCCNSNFRCPDSINQSTCEFCFAGGSSFAFAAPVANDAFCNALLSKNRCCNSGLVTGDGSRCYCP